MKSKIFVSGLFTLLILSCNKPVVRTNTTIDTIKNENKIQDVKDKIQNAKEESVNTIKDINKKSGEVIDSLGNEIKNETKKVGDKLDDVSTTLEEKLK